VAGIVLAVCTYAVHLHFASLKLLLVISLALAVLVVCLWRRKSKPKNGDQEEMSQVDRGLFKNSSVRSHIAVGGSTVIPTAVPLHTTTSSGHKSTASSRHSPCPSRLSNSGFGSVVTNPLALAGTETTPSPRCTNVPILPPALPPYERHLRHPSLWLNPLPTPHDSISETKHPHVQSHCDADVAKLEAPCESGTTISSTTTGQTFSIREDTISDQKAVDITDRQPAVRPIDAITGVGVN
jgi:hypothetical protein